MPFHCLPSSQQDCSPAMVCCPLTWVSESVAFICTKCLISIVTLCSSFPYCGLFVIRSIHTYVIANVIEQLMKVQRIFSIFQNGTYVHMYRYIYIAVFVCTSVYIYAQNNVKCMYALFSKSHT